MSAHGHSAPEGLTGQGDKHRDNDKAVDNGAPSTPLIPIDLLSIAAQVNNPDKYQRKFEAEEPQSDSESATAAKAAATLKSVLEFTAGLPEWWKNPDEWQINKLGLFTERKKPVDCVNMDLADILKTAEDLEKIPVIKEQLIREKAALDAQLQAMLKEKIENTQAGMGALADAQRIMQEIRDEMANIDKMCAEQETMVKNFENINFLARTLRNFDAAQQWKTNLETFGDRLAVVEEMLKVDDADKENMPNILKVHMELTNLRNMRDEAFAEADTSEDPSFKPTLEQWFEGLDGAIEWFDDLVGLIAVSLIKLVESDNNGLVVRFALIMKKEEESDQRVRALEEVFRDHKESAARFQGITDGARKVRGYKGRFIEAIQSYCSTQFDSVREEFLNDPTKLDKLMKWYFNDLNAVRLGMVRLMPKEFKIFKTYCDIYHKLMHDFLIGLIDDPDTSSAHALEIINWPEKYYKKMGKLTLKMDDLTPHVIDNREAELVKDFRQLIIKFLDEWIDRIFAQEQNDLANRNVEGSNLDQDEYGYFRTKNLVDMWRMLREQIDAAANSKRADVVEGVVDAMFLRLRNRQQSFMRMLETEAAKFEANKNGPDQLEGFQSLQDWLVATANDQIACIDDNEEEGRFAYLSDFKNKFEPLVSPGYLEHNAEREIAQLRDGYVDFSTWCMTRFAQLIFAVDFKAVMPDFFTPKWYTSTAMSRMVATFEEYVGDYRQVLHHSLVDIFIEIFADELLARYLGSVRNRGAKFRRADPYQDKIFDDLKTAFEYFSGLPNGMGDVIKEKWRVTEPFVELISADKDALPGVYERMKGQYWDLQMSWVEAVLRSRDDFERGTLNAVKARAAEMEVVRGQTETIMGKVK